ncbi:acyltransferase [Drechmeria coniospora]|uniref:Acyltransferase n=1 Tax=Drechmeria coniospora TaxID=98403 RepID=A0A151GGZ8_DRECN|nr:acyltransferase [Drechmeria coniospora]KYK56378.1 acyltransferase [Drechmeria coniospora]
MPDDLQLGLLDEQAVSVSDGESEDVPKPRDTASASPALSHFLSAVSLPGRHLKSVIWRPLLLPVVAFLLPSFLRPQHAGHQEGSRPRSATAYLDGIRGIASLFVFFNHYAMQAFITSEGWGRKNSMNHGHILKLPFLRLLYQGAPAVCLFFVISGYVLSYRLLSLIHRRAYSDFYPAVSSLVFRRGIRLFLPTMISTLAIVLLLRLGVYELTREFAYTKAYFRYYMEIHPDRLGSTFAQLGSWVGYMYEFVAFFTWRNGDGTPQYDLHLWAIPVEFRCSICLFVVIVGTARLRTVVRLVIVGAIALFVHRNSRWDLFLFLCGMVLAELDIIRGAHRHVSGTSSPTLCPQEQHLPPFRGRYKRILWSLSSLLGLYLLSQPDYQGEVTPGWKFLTSIIPAWWTEKQFRFWQPLGAIVFILAVGHSRGWQKFFNSAPMQYLGKISYAMYLMHGPVMHVIGYHWESMAYSITGIEGYWFNVGFFFGACFCIPTVIWAADIFWRAVDVPTVAFAKWFEKWCTVGDE